MVSRSLGRTLAMLPATWNMVQQETEVGLLVVQFHSSD